MGHDQLFKEILQAFLREFLKLFYPDVAERLDFSTLRFLDKELFTDFPEGSPREMDLVAEIRTHEETREIVLIHVEVQVKPEPDFDERMFQYYAMLWLRYRVPIFRSPKSEQICSRFRFLLHGGQFRSKTNI